MLPSHPYFSKLTSEDCLSPCSSHMDLLTVSILSFLPFFFFLLCLVGGVRVCDCRWNKSVNNAWLNARDWFSYHPDWYNSVLSLFKGSLCAVSHFSFFFFFSFPSSFSFASCSSVSEMILFSWRTESCLRLPRSCHSPRWLEFQCYKNGDEHCCSDSFSGLQVWGFFFFFFFKLTSSDTLSCSMVSSSLLPLFFFLLLSFNLTL